MIEILAIIYTIGVTICIMWDYIRLRNKTKDTLTELFLERIEQIISLSKEN